MLKGKSFGVPVAHLNPATHRIPPPPPPPAPPRAKKFYREKKKKKFGEKTKKGVKKMKGV